MPAVAVAVAFDLGTRPHRRRQSRLGCRPSAGAAQWVERQDAARAPLGQGCPFGACPRSVAGVRELRRSRSPTRSRAFLVTFVAFTKVTRCKSGTDLKDTRSDGYTPNPSPNPNPLLPYPNTSSATTPNKNAPTKAGAAHVCLPYIFCMTTIPCGRELARDGRMSVGDEVNAMPSSQASSLSKGRIPNLRYRSHALRGNASLDALRRPFMSQPEKYSASPI